MSAFTTSDTNGNLLVAVDLAKSVFQVAFVDPVKGVFRNYALTRKKFIEFLKTPHRKLKVVFEACGASHYWGRTCLSMGHEVMMIPAQSVKVFSTTNKDDKNDAKAIYQLASVPDLTTVDIRSEENQATGMMLLQREMLIKERTLTQNHLRGNLGEFGEVGNLGLAALKALAEEFIARCAAEGRKSATQVRVSLQSSLNMLTHINNEIKSIDEAIEEYAANSELCQKLMTIPFIGTLTAVALATVMADAGRFKNGRQFAAYVGMVPYHTGSGGKVTVLGISSKGNRVLKRILYQAALALYMRCKADSKIKSAKYSSAWVESKSEKPMKKVVCAIANRLCRISWAVAKSGGTFDCEKCSLLEIREQPVVDEKLLDEVLQEDMDDVANLNINPADIA